MKKMLRKMAGFFSRKTRQSKITRRIFFSESGPVGSEYLLIAALISLIIIGIAVKYKDYVKSKMADDPLSEEQINTNSSGTFLNQNSTQGGN